MAATTAGALKAWLEAAGLSIAVYRDSAPTGTARPYLTVDEHISLTTDASGDNGDDASVREQATVHVWQTPGAESPTLVDAVIQRLEGGHLPAGRTRVYGTSVDFSVRLVERDPTGKPTVIHHAITVTVRRTLEAV